LKVRTHSYAINGAGESTTLLARRGAGSPADSLTLYLLAHLRLLPAVAQHEPFVILWFRTRNMRHIFFIVATYAVYAWDEQNTPHRGTLR